MIVINSLIGPGAMPGISPSALYRAANSAQGQANSSFSQIAGSPMAMAATVAASRSITERGNVGTTTPPLSPIPLLIVSSLSSIGCAELSEFLEFKKTASAFLIAGVGTLLLYGAYKCLGLLGNTIKRKRSDNILKEALSNIALANGTGPCPAKMELLRKAEKMIEGLRSFSYREIEIPGDHISFLRIYVNLLISKASENGKDFLDYAESLLGDIDIDSDHIDLPYYMRVYFCSGISSDDDLVSAEKMTIPGLSGEVNARFLGEWLLEKFTSNRGFSDLINEIGRRFSELLGNDEATRRDAMMKDPILGPFIKEVQRLDNIKLDTKTADHFMEAACRNLGVSGDSGTIGNLFALAMIGYSNGQQYNNALTAALRSFWTDHYFGDMHINWLMEHIEQSAGWRPRDKTELLQKLRIVRELEDKDADSMPVTAAFFDYLKSKGVKTPTTTVEHVEALANVNSIIKDIADWFAGIVSLDTEGNANAVPTSWLSADIKDHIYTALKNKGLPW